MAELVHLRLERGLQELEEMERIGLFNRNEIGKLVKKRKAFEYKLYKRIKKKEDYAQYIQFEMNLLLLIKKRRERFLIDAKKKEIDNAISKKISKLFQLALKRYSDDQKLWLSHIEFCKKLKWYETISVLYSQMLQVHSKTPELWVSAAKWEMEDNNSPDNARKMYQKGVLLNPKSEILWREYFRMEFAFCDLIRKRRDILNFHNMKDSDESDAVLEGHIVNVVYDKATEEINDVNFALSFVQICLEYDFASRHIDYILKDIQDKFPGKEETLDALAKQPLLNIQEKIKEGKEAGMSKKNVLQKIHEKIYSKYDEAVKVVPTEKMWSFYIDFLLSLLNSAKEKNKIKLQTNVLERLEKAAESNHLALEYYSQWIDLLYVKGKEKDALSIALSAARKWNNVSLWFKCLTLHIQCRKSTKNVYALFTEALSSLKEKDSAPIWKLGVDWLSVSDPESLIEFFEKGIHKCKEISLPLKDMYLEATALRNGTQAARDLYKKFKKMGPLSMQLIKKMVMIEKGQLKPSMELLRKYYEDGIKELGSVNVDIWLEYMKLEVEHMGGNPVLYGILYWRAMKTLQPEFQPEFQLRVTDYATGCGLSTNWELVS